MNALNTLNSFLKYTSARNHAKARATPSFKSRALAHVHRSPWKKHRHLHVIGVVAAAWCGAALAVEPLPALHADLQHTSVSGISSGAYMAVQFHLAYSSIVKGAGVVAGGPFYCAKNDSETAIKNCMQPDAAHALPTVEELVSFTNSTEKTGAIDATQNLKDAKIWLFSGRKDIIVKQPVMDTLQRYYLNYVPATNIVYDNTVDAGHAFPTLNYGGKCSYTGSPFIDQCGIDGAGELLRHIYGGLNAPAVAPGGVLKEFDQREFFAGDAYAHSMRDSGFVYIPQACSQTSCRIHVAFHGCKQNVDAVGDNFIEHAGYNAWADTNHLIVLYPQTITRFGVPLKFWKRNFIFNPQGCWDWWGYDSADYYKKDGPQMRAIKKMLDRLASS